MLSDLFLYLHAPATGALTGYTVAQVRNKDGLVVDGAYRAVRRWALALPKEEAGQKVNLAAFPVEAAVHACKWCSPRRSVSPQVNLAAFPVEAAVHSPVRVLGDRSVLHKYVGSPP
jgi:hypothetical protein